MLLRLISICSFSLFAVACFSQFNNSFFEDRLTQVMDDETTLVITLPTVNATLYNGGFTYYDIYESDSKTLNIVTAADFNEDYNLVANARVSYGGLSLKKNNIIYSLHHEWNADANVNIAKEIFDVIVDGNAQFENDQFLINPTFQYITLHKWSLGAAYVNDKLHIGGQLHLYQGKEMLYGKQFEIDVTAEEDFFDLTFNKNIEVLSSSVLNYNSLDDIQFIGNNTIFHPQPFSKNLGIGAAIEALYKFSDNLSVFGRIDDIGSISWKTQAVTYTDNSQSSFNGIDIRDSYVNDEPYSIKDTLYNLLSIKETVGSFAAATPLSFLLGANYNVNEKLRIGLKYRGKQTASGLRTVLQVNAGLQLTRGILINASNTVLDGSLVNPGIGLRCKIGNTFNLFLDTINPWKFSKYYDANLLYFNFGTYLTL